MHEEWVRYSCQIRLPDFGEEKQLKLQNAKILIAGVGGLGCPAAQYLAASGVGKIGIADYDIVSVSNLHRQILYSPDDIGSLKSETACKKLQQQNPQIELVSYSEKITQQNVIGVVKDFDIVIDGTDNFETKYLLNDACVLLKKPLIYGAVYQYEGQISVLNIDNGDGTYSPNYRDLFPDANASQIPDCAEGGVMPAIAGIIGCMQANEAIKYLIGDENILSSKMLIMDSKTLQSRIINTGEKSKILITQLSEFDEVKLISANELNEMIAKDNCILIDVRNAEEREKYNIGGKNIPLQEIENSFSCKDENRPVIFYCESGRRSEEAARIAKRKFSSGRFFSLEGGLNAWKDIEITT